ncbi:MAG: triose-phosphate isomerase [Candidatus Aenigmatarchaeota archaeon]
MIIALNFKAFKETIGKNCIKTIKEVKSIAKENVIFIINPADISLTSYFFKKRKFKIFTSLSFAIESYGQFTGKIPIEFLKDLKIEGVLINHSENRINFSEIKKFVEISKKYEIETMVCVKSIKEAKITDKLKPNYIAYEDPKLIGTGIPISKAKSSSVKKFAESIKSIPICGAGITNKEDVIAAKELGCKGVLIASAFAKSKNKKQFLKEIMV